MLKTKVSYHVDPDAFLSGSEIAKQSFAEMDSLKLAMMYPSSAYNLEEVIKGVQSVNSDIPVIGCTSELVMVADGIVDESTGFASMMAISDEDMVVTIAGSEEKEDRVEVGRQIALEAIRKSGLRIRPSYCYMIASSHPEEYLCGIEEVIGRVPLFGGGVAQENSKIFVDDKVFSSGCAIAFFYTDKEFKTKFTSAYQETEKVGIITKLDSSNILEEIDGKEAVLKYAEWCGVSEESLKEPETWKTCALTPLAVKSILGDMTLIRKLESIIDHKFVMSNPLAVHTAVIQMTTSKEDFVSTIKSALEDVTSQMEQTIGAYFLILDKETKELFKENLEEIYQTIKEVVKEVPFLVTFTQSQYGYQCQSSNVCGSLMMSMTAIEE